MLPNARPLELERLSDKPVILRDLHLSILIRVYVLGGTSVSSDRIAKELRLSHSVNDVQAAIGDMKNGLVSVDGLASQRITLSKDGYRQARMVLDVIALTQPSLFGASATASQFMDHFARRGKGVGQIPSRLQIFKLQMKWLFRRNWEADVNIG